MLTPEVIEVLPLCRGRSPLEPPKERGTREQALLKDAPTFFLP